MHLINRKWMVSTFEMEDILVHMHDVSPDGTVQDMNLKIEPWPPAAAYEELATATGMEVLMLNEMRYSLLQWSQVSPTTEDPRGKLARFTKANKQWMQQLKKVHSLRGSIQSDETGQNTRPSQDRQYRVETATKEAPAAIPSNSGLGDPNDLASAGVGIAENDTFARRPAILPLMQDSDRYSKMLEAAA